MSGDGSKFCWMTIEELARRAYVAYGDVVEWKNYQGHPMPTWSELPSKIRDAWIGATKATDGTVREECAMAIEWDLRRVSRK